jgi:hypothetical protein
MIKSHDHAKAVQQRRFDLGLPGQAGAVRTWNAKNIFEDRVHQPAHRSTPKKTTEG